MSGSGSRLWATVQLWGDYFARRRGTRRPSGTPTPLHQQVLVLVWSFPPEINGGVFRPLSWARYWLSEHRRLTFVTGPIPSKTTDGGRALAATIDSSVRVLPSRQRSTEPFRRLVPAVDGGFDSALRLCDAADAAFSNSHPSILVATGPPFHVFVAGTILSRQWDCPLVLDYRDEWSLCPFEFVEAGPTDRVWEERANRQARAIVFVSPSQMRHHLAAFPATSAERCVVIPNGWEPSEYEVEDVTPVVRDTAVVRIVFAGTLGSHTLPRSFLETFANVCKHSPTLDGRRWQLEFIGRQDAEATAELDSFPAKGVIVSHGLKSKAETIALSRSADVLLILNNEDLARYIPGKLYEYLASGRPVLAYGTGGEIERVLRETVGGIVVPEDDPGALLQGLRSCMELGTAETEADSPRNRWLAAHTRERAAEQFAKLLKQVIESPAKPDR